jgi:hypothetical protein
MERDFGLRMSDVEKVLVEMEQRGHRYFDETLRIGRVFDLLNKNRVREGFEREVVADAPREVERKVGDLIDWLVDANLRQWQGVNEHLAERRRRYRERIVGDASATVLLGERSRLVDAAGREAQRVVETYDKAREAQALAESARNAVATAAAVGAGAVGLGTVVTIVATTAAADVTGLVMASVLAAAGLFILPHRRRRAKQEMRTKVTAMRETLVGALRREFEREMEHGRARIAEGIGPYSRFVRSEHETVSGLRETFEAAGRDLQLLRERIEPRPGA